MDVQEIMEQLGNELVKQLARADSAEELAKMAQEQNHALTAEEAEVVFAALYPVRGKQAINDEDELLAAVGGLSPKQSCPKGKAPPAEHI